MFCQGPFEESNRYREFMGWEMPCYSVPETSVDALLAGRHFGMNVCYLRDGDRVFETYWTTGRGNETMGSSYAMLDHDRLRPPGALGGLAGGLAAAVPRHAQRADRTDEHGHSVGRPGGRPISQWPRLAAGHSDDLG